MHLLQSARLLYLSSLLILLPPPPSSAAANLVNRDCGDSNYAENSPFAANLGHLLSSLSNSSTNSTFATLTEGSVPDIAYGLFLCRGDISPSECRNCVQTSAVEAPQICPSSDQVTLWYEICELRYSRLSFFGTAGDFKSFSYPAGPGASDPDTTFADYAGELMRNLSDRAAQNSTTLFATGEISYGGEDRTVIYGLTQCTRDLSGDMCSRCLGELLSNFNPSSTAGGTLETSCGFRYGTDKFFEGEPVVSITVPSPPPASAPSPSPPPPPSAPTGEDRKRVLTNCGYS